MAFHDDRLPPVVETGARIITRFNTTIATTASGAERRNQNWSQGRLAADLASGLRRRADMDGLRAHFRARAGRTHSFPFKDLGDFTLVRQAIGATDGSTATFQIYKRYSSGGVVHDRIITKPVTGTVFVWVNNAPITLGAGAGQAQVSRTTGIVTLGTTLRATTGQAVEVACEFDVPVRYDTDDMDLELRTWESSRWGNIQVIEVRE